LLGFDVVFVPVNTLVLELLLITGVTFAVPLISAPICIISTFASIVAVPVVVPLLILLIHPGVVTVTEAVPVNAFEPETLKLPSLEL
jgi:hypothetical protein